MSIQEYKPTPQVNLPHTGDGALDRSDSRIRKRKHSFENHVEDLKTENEGAHGAFDASMAADIAAIAFCARQEERQRDHPDHDLSADVEKARNARRRTKARKEKCGERQTAIQARLHPAVGQLDEMTSLIASYRTEAEIPFVPSAMYSADVDDPLAECATRRAVLAETVRERGQVANKYQSAEDVVRTLLRRLDQKAEAGEIALSGLTGKGVPSFSLPLAVVWAQPARNREERFPLIPDVEALACRHWHDEIAADIKQKVAETYAKIPPEAIMDADERRERLRVLDAEIDRLQREIADLTWMAREAGHDVDFAGLPARAILGIA